MELDFEEEKPKRGRPKMEESKSEEVKSDDLPTMKACNDFLLDIKNGLAYKKLILSLGHTLSNVPDKVKKETVKFLMNNK